MHKTNSSKRIEKARKVLGITKSATEQEVKRIYKALAKKWHPDTNKTKEAKNKIREINHSFQLIMKEQFNKIDPWEDYNTWWWKQYGNDPIWGNYISEEDKTAIAHKKSLKKYLESCQSEFWTKVFEKEVDYILRELSGCKNVLTVGCGPAFVERGLLENGFNVTGLDVSKEAFEGAPDSLRKKVGSAEDMHSKDVDLKDASFDAAIYVASLQFIDNYEQALQETARVLKPEGRLLVMLLNPGSEFVKDRLQDNPDSYMQKMKHEKVEDIPRIEAAIRQYFNHIKTEYYLGIKGQEVFETQDPALAALYIIQGDKK